MKNIHILPTDKPSKLYFHNLNNRFGFSTPEPMAFFGSGSWAEGRNIYIISDEEIKEGNWFLPQGHINPHKLKGYNKINGDLESYNGLCYDISKCKKIILTTDQDLIKDGVQAIDDEFLEWFVKNPSCEFVQTDKILQTRHGVNWYDLPNQKTGNEVDGIYRFYYKIIIPKEEPKQETLEELKKWKEEALIAHEINQKVIEKLMAEKKLMYSEEQVLPLLEMLEKCQEYFLLKTDAKSEERADALGQAIEDFKKIKNNKI